MTTRRAFVLGAAGGAVALAARPAAAPAAPQGEAAILDTAVKLEQLAAYVYEAGIASGLLDVELATTLATLRDHEKAHADALATALDALGAPRPAAPDSPQAADAALEQLGITERLAALSDGAALLDLVLRLEQRQVALYHQAVVRLDTVRLIQTIASIVASDGQHLVVVRRALERPPVPSALELGRP